MVCGGGDKLLGVSLSFGYRKPQVKDPTKKSYSYQLGSNLFLEETLYSRMAFETTFHHWLGGPSFNATGVHSRGKTTMHMSFYWGRNAVVLFSGWPGTSKGMYALTLIFVFFLALLVEWLSFCNFIKPEKNDLVSGLLRTALYTVRAGVSYLVMLAVMSFNGGVFLAAVAGRAIGYVGFGTWASRKSNWSADLPPMSC